MQQFDSDVGKIVDTGKMTSSSMQAVCKLALSNMKYDAHMVSTLFRLHKRAKPENKLWALYVIDAISRDCRSVMKKGKGKETKSSPASFLQKMEVCLERVYDESMERGAPEHRAKVAKLLGIWNSSATFSKETLDVLNAKSQQKTDNSNTIPNSIPAIPPPPEMDPPLPVETNPLAKDPAVRQPSTSSLPAEFLAALTGQRSLPTADSNTTKSAEISSPDVRNPAITPAQQSVSASQPPPPVLPNGMDSAAINALLQSLSQTSTLTPPQLNDAAPIPSTSAAQVTQSSFNPYAERQSPPHPSRAQEPARFRQFSPATRRSRSPPDRRRSTHDGPSEKYRMRDRSFSPPARPSLPERPIDSSSRWSKKNDPPQQFQPLQTYTEPEVRTERESWQEQIAKRGPVGVPRYSGLRPSEEEGMMNENNKRERSDSSGNSVAKRFREDNLPEETFSLDGPSFQLNSQGFPDFTSFDPQEALSWAKLGRTFHHMFGYVPNNEQLIAICTMIQNMPMMLPQSTNNGSGENMANDFFRQMEQELEEKNHEQELSTDRVAITTTSAQADDDMDMDNSSEEEGPPLKVRLAETMQRESEAVPDKSGRGKMTKVGNAYVFVPHTS